MHDTFYRHIRDKPDARHIGFGRRRGKARTAGLTGGIQVEKTAAGSKGVTDLPFGISRHPLITLLMAGFATTAPAGAQELAMVGGSRAVAQLKSLSIEELAQVEVTTASKRAEPISAAAASIFVITGDDILRSGAPSLPEALRLAPNLNVRRTDARQYSIQSRGFGGIETSNKMLVLIDGRSIYSTLASSVFWELYDPMIEDIDRIEVVSGPGGTLYGANAVNGVISIASRSALDTLGGVARANGGAFEQDAALRYGFALGNDSAIRLYANGYQRDGLPASPTRDLRDGGSGFQTGFRFDREGNSHITLQGDVFDHDNDTAPGDGDNGQNLLARLTTPTGAASELSVQAYYDRFQRVFTLVKDRLETLDLSVQHNWQPARHAIVVGFGVRTTNDLFANRLNAFVLDPESRRLWLGNVFAQDSWTPIPELTLTAGVKVEQTTFTGIEVLPNFRVAWKPGEASMLWGAVSRAVREPSRIDRQLVFPGILLPGTFQAEELTAIEAGYRGQPTPDTSLSVSLFYNLQDKQRTTALSPAGTLPVRLANGLKGHSYGIEAWGVAQVTPAWRVSAGLATIHKDFHLRAGQTDLQNGISLGNDPDFQIKLRSQVDLGPLTFDTMIRLVDSLPDPPVKTYVDADARLAWQATDTVEVYLSGQNLFHATRDESNDVQRGQLVRRSVMAGTRLRF